MNIYFTLLISLLFCTFVHAKNPIYDISFGINYQSLKVHQGVILYNDFQINPDLNFKIINDHWEFVGDSINFSHYIIEDKLKYRSKIWIISDHPFFPKKQSTNSITFHRKESTEWVNRIEYNFNSYSTHYIAQICFEFAHDLFVHHGNYFDLETKIKLFKYKSIEPNLYTLIGWGDYKNNSYYYGENAKGFGENNFELGLNFLLPEEIDRYYSVFQIHYFEITDSKNKNANYARNNNHGIQLSLTIVKNIN